MRRRKILNLYALRRKMTRRISRAKNQLFMPVVASKRHKDYSWHRSKSNPYVRKDYKYINKKKIEIVITAICILTTLSLLLYHKAFRIDTINVEGLRRLTQHEITESVYASLAYNKLYLFPANSYIMTDTASVMEVIQQKFPIEKIEVKKSFPNTLSIVLEEKISTIIYDNGKEYSYIGLDGRVVETLRMVGEDEWKITKEMVTSTKENGDLFMEEVVVEEKHTPPITQIKTEMGDYPIIYKDMKKELETNDIVISDNIASSIIEWFNYFEKKTEIPFGYAEVTNEVGDTTLHTREGWDIIVRADSTTKDQIERLESVLREKVDRSKINYIDVRFKVRVYWQ